MNCLLEASKSVFYECSNAISICNRSAMVLQMWGISGCENCVGHRGYCYVCQIVDTYFTNDFEKVKYEPVKFFKLAGESSEDVKLCYEFNPQVDFWLNGMEFKWRDIALGEMGSVYLKDWDHFRL